MQPNVIRYVASNFVMMMAKFSSRMFYIYFCVSSEIKTNLRRCFLYYDTVVSFTCKSFLSVGLFYFLRIFTWMCYHLVFHLQRI